jgi:hypothetical protein
MFTDAHDASKFVKGISFQEPTRPLEVWLREGTAMPRYQIDEMDGDALSASHIASGTTALEALRKIAGKAISTRALQDRWFRVIDQSGGSVFEYSIEHELTSRR